MMTPGQKADNDAKIQYGKTLMVNFKYQNITDGITGPQAVHLEYRMDNIPFIQSDGTVETNSLYNKMITGDLDTAYFILLYMQPDDMSKPYHSVTQAKIDYLKNALASFLGL